LVELSKQNNFKKHNSSDYPFDVSNSFKGWKKYFFIL
jgi:hypothetical protein